MKATNQANQYLLTQLAKAQKGVMACSRRGLTVIDFRIAGGAPTISVQHNTLTQKWVEHNKAFVYVLSNRTDNQMILTAQRMICGCRVIFSYPRPTSLH